MAKAKKEKIEVKKVIAKIKEDRLVQILKLDGPEVEVIKVISDQETLVKQGEKEFVIGTAELIK